MVFFNYGLLDPDFYQKHKFGILPYFVMRNSTGFYNLECGKALTKTKIHTKNGCLDLKTKKNYLHL